MRMIKLQTGLLLIILFQSTFCVAADALDFSAQRDKAILLHIINDKNDKVDKFIVKTEVNQFFVCTLLNGQCVLAVFQANASPLQIKAQMESGESYYGTIENAIPGSEHIVHVSELGDTILF